MCRQEAESSLVYSMPALSQGCPDCGVNVEGLCVIVVKCKVSADTRKSKSIAMKPRKDANIAKKSELEGQSEPLLRLKQNRANMAKNIT